MELKHCSFASTVIRGIMFVIVLSQSGTASAQTTWYVDDDNCPGPGSGIVGDPFCSIQSAIDIALSGDLVLVAAGTYNESIDFLGKAIVLRVESRSTGATIDGTGQDDSVVKFINSEGPGSVLDGFSIVEGIGALMEVEPGTFKRVGGGILVEGSSPTLLNCSFKSNSAQRGGGVCVTGGANPSFVNCLFIDNSAENGGGLYGTNESNPTIVNCVLRGNTASIDGGGLFNTTGCCDLAPSNPVLSNCILWGNSPNQLVDDVASFATVSFSDIQGGWSGAGSDNLAVNPWFTNASSGNLRLLNGSPCIDAGQNIAVPLDSFDLDDDGNSLELTPIDREGFARFRNAAVDMGAFESDHCPVDINGDGLINITDFIAILATLGVCPSPCPTDINNDGVVNVTDIVIFLQSPDACPEPIPVLPCPGDFDEDGQVSINDLVLLLGGWGPNPGHVADTDDDGSVNVTDLVVLLAAWGACP